MFANRSWLAVAAQVLLPGFLGAQKAPIIDVHMHARTSVMRAADGTPIPRPCDPQPCSTKVNDADVAAGPLRGTLAAMERQNIVLGVLSGAPRELAAWRAAIPAPERFIVARFPGDIGNDAEQKLALLRRDVASGKIGMFGEIGTQYEGLAPDDPRLAPYFALAEELDVPVLIHTAGLGAHAPGFRAANGRPLLLEGVVASHPRLRIYVENAGYPFLDEIIALMTMYPNVHADVSTITWIIPRPAFHRYLRALVDAGLGKRIMFGSDQMEWPETIDLAVDAIESASFLSAEQKRDIFYNNAARFLRVRPADER